MKNNYPTKNKTGFSSFILVVSILLSSVFVKNASAQTTLNTTTVPGFANNNGTGLAAFNFENTNPFAIIITDVEGIVSTAGLTSADVWIKTTPISGPPGAISNANGWFQMATGTFTGIANTTTLVTQPMLTGISVNIPSGVTYGMAITAYSGATGRLRYCTMPAGTLPLTTVSGGGCNILLGTNIAYGGTSPPPAAPINTPRAFIGKITFVPAVACTSPPTPGNATATPSSGICTGANIVLSLTGNSGGTGQTYQWQSSAAIGGPYTNLGSSQTSPSLNTPSTSTLYYRCEVTCSGNSQNSTPVLVTVDPPFAGGTYTINSAIATGGLNFQTFTDFKNALSCGISGAIVANVVTGSGPYNEQVEFGVIGGASSTNTITINGNGNTLTFGATVSTAPGTLILNGTDYMTVNNLIVEGTGATYALVCHLWNQADNNAFNNCTFNAPANGTGTAQVPFSISGSATAATTAGVSGNNNVITGCTMFSGYYNTCIVGNSSGNSTGNQVINCNIRDQYFYGIYIYYQTGAIIRGNILERPTRTTLSTYYGIYVLTGCTNMLVEKNKIRNTWATAPTSTGTQYSIYSSIDASAGNENKYINNLISDINFNGTIYGMYFTGADYWQAYHNTISLDQTSATGTTTTYGIYSSGTLAYDARNNIISISRGGTGTKYCVNYVTLAAATSNYNDLYMNAAAGTNYIGNTYTTLSAWQSASGKDANSVSVDPLYVAPGTDYTPGNGLVNDIGTPLGVTTDITNAARSATTPDPGAYEFSLGGLDAGISWVSPTSPAVAGTYPVTVNINNTQAQTIVSLDLSYSDGGTPITETFTGLNITAGTNQNLTFTTQYNLTMGVTMTVNILSVNGGSDAVSGNNTDTYSLCIALSGNYTINAGAAASATNFQSFTAAIAALACGIPAPVVFDVVAGSGPYNEQVSIPPVAGVSAVNTITFNGNGNTLTFAASAAATPHTFALAGADYVNVNNLIIEGTGATYALVCHLWNQSDNNTFTNCTFNAPANGTSTTQVPFSISGSASVATTAGISGNDNVITGCTIFSGYYNTAIVGNSSGNSTDNQVLNCNIRDQYFYATYFLYQTGLVFSGNTLERPTRTTLSTYYGIYISTGCTNVLVEKNKIRNTWATAPASTGTQYTIYCTIDASVGNENKFYNNLISDINFNGTIYGMYMSGSDYWQAYHNTISLDETGSTSTSTTYGIYATGTVAKDARNNIITISRGGTGTKYCVYFSNQTGVTCNYNDLYMNAASGTANYIGYNGTSHATLAAWQSGSGYDLNSVSENPLYISPGTGNYKPSASALDNIGTGLGVTTDILGATRSAVDPDPGAYEFSVSPKDAGVLSLIAPGSEGCYSSTETITVEIKNYGSTALDFSVDPLTVTVNVTGAATATLTGSPTGTLPVAGTMNVTMSTTLNMTTNGTYAFNAYTTMASDGNLDNNTMLPDSRTAQPVAGTVSSTQTSICVSGTPTLSVTGNSGGTVQWQESTASVSGPWTNVGAGGNSYTPPSAVTQTTYYRAEINCNTNSVASNVATVSVTTPQITGTTGATRCGIGSVTLSATATGQGVINWFSTPTGGTSLGTGSSYTTTVSATTDFYAEETTAGGSSGASPIQITETDLGASDQLEIQNVSGDPVNISGWKVAISDDYSIITAVNANIQTLSGTMNPGATMTWTDNTAGPNYWGSNMLWNPGAYPSFTGWAAIIDNNNILKDFVVWNWPSANIQGATLVIDGNSYTVGTQWNGNGIDASTVAATQSLSRQGTLDDNDLTDFSVINLSMGTTNPGITLPFTGFGCSSTRVAATATVTPPPSISVIAADQAVCTGNSTTVSVNSSNDPDYTYSWTSNPAGFTASGAGPHTVSPTVSTWYIVTATDNSAGPNAGCVEIDSVQIATGGTLTSGTVATSQSSYCNAGEPTLTVTGADGGAIQWQSSTVSASGPWSNVGTGTTLYNPGTLTQTTYFQVVVSCQSSSVTSNAVTVNILTPTITSSTGATRCGYGPVTLQATGSAGTTLNWYTASTGGSSLGTGTSFTTNVGASTNYYVGASTGTGGTQTTTMPPQSTTFATNVRGYWFTAPASFTITGVTVPLTGTLQHIAIVKFNGAVPPPTYSASTNAFTTEFLTQNNSSTGMIACNVSVTAGDVIGILGQRDNLTSYGPATNPAFVTIAGSSVPLTRMLMQHPLATFAPQDLSQEVTATTQIGRIEFEYSTGCESERTAVPVTINPSTPINVTSNFTSICAGNQAQLSVNSSNDPNYTYSWTSTPAGFTASGPGPHNAAVSSTTTFNVTAYDAGSDCGALGSVTVTAVTNPLSLSANATPPAVCPGTNSQLNAVGTAPGYTMSTNCGVSFIDIGSTGTSVGTVTDDSQFGITLPAFTFNGVSYTTALVGSNGVIVLGTNTGTITLTNAALPTTAITAGNIFLAPYWDDLDVNLGGTIKTQTVGSTFIIQYTGMDHNLFTTGTITFQVQLNLSTGVVSFIYPDVVFGSATYDNGLTATVGIQYSSTSALQYSFNTASLVNGINICFTPNVPSLTYDWSLNPTFLSATNISNPVAQAPTSSQTYTVVITDAGNGCTKSQTVAVTVNPPPQPLASSNAPVCVGFPLSLFGDNIASGQNTGNSWSWSGPSYTSSLQNPSVSGTATTANAGTYTLTVTNSLACTSTMSVDVVVNPNPVVSVGTQINVSCNGLSDGEVDLVASNGTPQYSYNLNGLGTLDGIYTGLSAAGSPYIANVSDDNGCQATPLSITITEPNVLVATAGSNTPVCTGTSINLTSSATGGTLTSAAYSWTGPNGAVPAVQNPTIASATTTDGGQYDVEITDANGCTATSSHTVIVNESPTAAIALSGSANKCLGQSGTVQLTFTGPGPWDYTISGSGGPYTGNTSSNPANVNVTPTAAGTQNYTVTSVGNAGCPTGGTGSGTATLYVSTAPPVNTAQPQPQANYACSGTVQLITVPVIPGQNIRYSWNTGSASSVVLFSTNIGGPFSPGPFQTVTNQVYAQFQAVIGSGYNICVQGINGCGSTNNRCVTIRGKVSVPGTISPPSGIVGCANTTQSYSCGVSGGATQYNWTLSGSPAAISSGQGTQNVSVLFPNGFTSGQLCVTAQLPCGGSSISAPRCININNNPTVPGAMTGPTKVCPGSTGVTFSVPPVTGATGYSWTTPAGTTVTSGAGTNSITVNFPNPYTGAPPVCVTANSACGASVARCQAVGSYLPNQPGAIAGPSTNICNSTVQYSIASMPGASSYNWTNPSGTTITSGQSSTTILLSIGSTFTTGTLTVTANTTQCTPGTSIPRSITLTGKPNTPGTETASPTSWCNGGFVNFSVVSPSPVPTYNWTVSNGTITAGQGSNNIDVTWGTGSGTVNVNASNGCGGSTIHSQSWTGLGCREEGMNATADFTVYPNPVHDKVTVSIDVKETTGLIMQLMDVSGRVVLSQNETGTAGFNNYDLNLTHLSKGVYMLEVKSPNNNWKTKVVVE